MRYSSSLISTASTAPKGISIGYDLSLRAGITGQLGAGLFHFLPLGTKVLYKIEGIIRAEMENTGAAEVNMPIMHPQSLWEESGRLATYGEAMFTLNDINGRGVCLAPTHEEAVVSLARTIIKSHKQLPSTLFQFGRKLRNEERPEDGLVRTLEFRMKDAYSFGRDQEDLNRSYATMREAYFKILNRMDVTFYSSPADTGEMGGSFSEEFLAPTPRGKTHFKLKKDIATQLEKEQEGSLTGTEICHIFQLGTKYSEKMKLVFDNGKGAKVPVFMGCYGIGTSRLIPIIIEQNHDEHGIIWPREIAPFDVMIVPTRYDGEIKAVAEEIYTSLQTEGIDVLLDDRDFSPGKKFTDADLIGIPHRIVVGNNIRNGLVDVKRRVDGEQTDLRLDNLVEGFLRFAN